MRRIYLSVVAAVCLPGFGVGVDFNREVRPILSDNCFQCHGPDEKRRFAGLRLDVKEGAFSQSKRGAIIVPGDSAKSLLYQRITHAEKARRMPPAASERTLTAKQIETIKSWIDGGAKWETHWAFTAPVKPELPAVKDAEWVRNPIDRFILARLEAEGLKPSPEADRAVLLRRLSFDLTGLPPTPAEVAAFVGDKSPDAYEKQVDRLLGSERYGERMAMQWLDIARYADSHGYHIDSHRDMWPWRDWVIRAYNANMPFDRFTILQLAGDLLPNAGRDELIPTGFNRNHMINFEGGAIPEEYQTEYVVDRVETTSTAWMGLTMGCARCHSHKYDPISQKEFYQFYAFFNSVNEKGLDGREGNAKPRLMLYTPAEEARKKELDGRIKEDAEFFKSPGIVAVQEKWRRELGARDLKVYRDGLLAHYEFDGSLADSSGRYAQGRTVNGDPTFGQGRVARAVQFDGETVVSLGPGAGFESGRAGSLALWLNYGGAKQPMPVFEKIVDRGTRRGFEIWFEDPDLVGIQKRAGYFAVRLSAKWPDSAIEVRTERRITQSEWNHYVLNYDGSGKAAGFELYVNGKPEKLRAVRDSLNGATASNANLLVGVKEPDSRAFSGAIDDLRFYDHKLEAEVARYMAIDYPAHAITSGIGGKVTKSEDLWLTDYYFRYVAEAELHDRYVGYKAAVKECEALEKSALSTMVMDEMEKPRDSFVLARGDYRNQTEKVSPGVPAILPPLAEGEKPNRLALAKWLVSGKHPLTARVAVNRYWQIYFGTGLVKTAENLGSQGEPPSHPELLDWLAAEFEAKWDVKAMQRLIVTSAAYRQSSKTTPALMEKDPENRLIARGPRFRLPAEMVRDNALAVSGLLNAKVGGPPVFPYQPPGIWEELAFGDGFSMQNYVQSHGEDLYRRSMYTFWKRTAPPAQMLVFDAPDREKCTARRSTTNTPLQALVLLNDPTYIEASRALAAKALKESGKDARKTASLIFESATERKPDKAEVALMTRLARKQLAVYAKDPKSAAALLKTGESPVDSALKAVELAAWTTVASAVLNLDETVTKE